MYNFSLSVLCVIGLQDALNINYMKVKQGRFIACLLLSVRYREIVLIGATLVGNTAQCYKTHHQLSHFLEVEWLSTCSQLSAGEMTKARATFLSAVLEVLKGFCGSQSSLELRKKRGIINTSSAHYVHYITLSVSLWQKKEQCKENRQDVLLWCKAALKCVANRENTIWTWNICYTSAKSL